MWPFTRNKTLIRQGVFQGFTDYHSHILPGVDDGVKTIQDSLHILYTYEDWGVREVYLTPHIQEYLPNTTSFLNTQFNTLLQAYTGPITLHLSAEYMLDNLLLERLHSHDLLYHTPLSSQFSPLSSPPQPSLLLETSYLSPPINLHEILHEVQSIGITPILAHPERYHYMSLDDYQRLHDQGIHFQLNLPSLLGLYGKEPKRRAHYLLSNNLITLFGTDIHTPHLLTQLQNTKITPLPTTP